MLYAQSPQQRQGNNKKYKEWYVVLGYTTGGLGFSGILQFIAFLDTAIPSLQLVGMSMYCVSVHMSVRAAISHAISRSVTLDRLLVRVNVELYEESKVTGKNSASKKCGGFASSTVSLNGEARILPISVNKMRVCSKVDREQINNELCNLHTGQILFPPDFSTTGSRIIIVIHKDMNTEIQGNY